VQKFRRKILYNQKREIVGKILRKLCEWKDVEIIEAEVCPDHIHMLVAIPPKLSVSSFMGYLKGKSCLELFDTIPELAFRNFAHSIRMASFNPIRNNS